MVAAADEIPAWTVQIPAWTVQIPACVVAMPACVVDSNTEALHDAALVFAWALAVSLANCDVFAWALAVSADVWAVFACALFQPKFAPFLPEH